MGWSWDLGVRDCRRKEDRAHFAFSVSMKGLRLKGQLLSSGFC